MGGELLWLKKQKLQILYDVVDGKREKESYDKLETQITSGKRYETRNNTFQEMRKVEIIEKKIITTTTTRLQL